MKKHLIFIILLVPLFTFAQKGKKQSPYIHVKSLYADLNNDGKADTIIVSSNTQYSGAYNRITIKLAGFPKQTFKAKQYWKDFDSLFLKHNKNLVHSNLLFIKNTGKHTVVLLSGGTDGAGYGIEFSIINIENNQSKMVLDDDGDIDVEIPVALTDLDKDKRLDFVYRKTFQCDNILKKGKICAYSPYFVYSVDDNCKLNKPLMKSYNQDHYVFDGYQYSEKIKIYYPDDNSLPSIWHHGKTQK